MDGLSSVDTGLLSGLSDVGSNLAKGVAMLTMQNILKISIKKWIANCGTTLFTIYKCL